MSIMDRAALEQSPLADLHAIASELSIDGYRRLRRAELIDAILARQDGRQDEEPADEPSGEEPSRESLTDPDELADVVTEELHVHDEERPSARRRRGRRGGRARDSRDEPAARAEGPGEIEREVERAREEEDEEIVEGVVELLPNGSGFMRVNPPEPSDEDVYISAAQVKRCELVSGDRIAGPRRPPRRSERFASLIRIDTINERPAAEVADSVRFDDLPAVFPSERFRLGSEDPTVKAIEWLTPFGRGSRTTIVGPAQAGKTEALRRLAAALQGQEDLQLLLVLAGVRPEEISVWNEGPVAPVAAVSFADSPDSQAQTVERAIDQGRRLASRGMHAVVLVDSLAGLPAGAARKALAAARCIVDGGSLTVVATAPAPLGGETTVIALDASLTGTGRFPALDLAASWTMQAERLVGEVGAEAIVRARAEAVEG